MFKRTQQRGRLLRWRLCYVEFVKCIIILSRMDIYDGLLSDSLLVLAEVKDFDVSQSLGRILP